MARILTIGEVIGLNQDGCCYTDDISSLKSKRYQAQGSVYNCILDLDVCDNFVAMAHYHRTLASVQAIFAF